MISPTHKGSKRLEETFLGSLVLRKEKLEGDELQIGRSTAPLTRLNAENQLNELAKGAATVFAYLMKGNTLTYVKNWLETIERKTSALVVDFVSMFVSPALISENLRIVMSHSPDREPSFALDDNFSVEVSFPHKCINLSYEMEDVSISMRISFPEAFPLRQPVVDSSTARENGISSEKWRSWVLKMTVLLFSGTSDIWGCVELFHRNMDAHFNGQEPCPICFAVVNSMNHKLPDKRCSVCKNARFHAYCLGTWWASCGQTICPLCRSPWV
ncbi:hypothetical protein AGDE_00387 [Angomonas deanei]|nr:hypothetical protein AGDE_00387 [Angomonas deanei]|eukprot:EPY43534.1 hypothetical protein AGDE_00387 [Angomonas deanei]